MKSNWLRTLALSTLVLGGVYAVDTLQEHHVVHASSEEMVTIDGFQYPKEVVNVLNHINSKRKEVGLEPYKIDPFLTKSAQNHAEYVSMHDSAHYQEKGKSGFTGVDYIDRAKAAGYTIKSGSEAISTGPQPALTKVNDLIEGIFHRRTILGSQYDTVGIGIADGVLVVVSDNTDLNTGKAYAYPYDGQKDVFRAFTVNEIPNPLDKYGVNKAGYPISYYPGEKVSWRASLEKKHKMYLMDSRGNNVELLSKNNVPEEYHGMFYIFPKDHLKRGEKYTVTIEYYDSKENLKTYSWSFTTRGTPEKPENPVPTESDYQRFYQRFSDFNHNEWWTNDIIWAIDKGLIQGYPDKNTGKALIKPNGTLTEAHALTILLRYFKPGELEKTKATSNWVYNVQYQLAKKYKLPTVANESSSTKKQLATQGIRRGTLARLLVSLDYGYPVEEGYAIKVLIQTGVTTAKNQAEFRANETLTRAQVSAFIKRYDDYIRKY